MIESGNPQLEAAQYFINEFYHSPSKVKKLEISSESLEIKIYLESGVTVNVNGYFASIIKNGRKN
jgi:hypothetical protein